MSFQLFDHYKQLQSKRILKEMLYFFGVTKSCCLGSLVYANQGP